MVKFEEKRIIDCRSHEINFLFEEDVRKALRRTVYRGPQALEFAVWFAVESVKSVSYDPASNIVVRWGEGKTRKRYNWVHFARLLHAAFPISFSRKDSWFSRVLDSPLRFFFFFFSSLQEETTTFSFRSNNFSLLFRRVESSMLIVRQDQYYCPETAKSINHSSSSLKSYF